MQSIHKLQKLVKEFPNDGSVMVFLTKSLFHEFIQQFLETSAKNRFRIWEQLGQICVIENLEVVLCGNMENFVIESIEEKLCGNMENIGGKVQQLCIG